MSHHAANASILIMLPSRHTCVHMADGTSRESSSISGSDYSEFEASMEGEHSERVY